MEVDFQHNFLLLEDKRSIKKNIIIKTIISWMSNKPRLYEIVECQSNEIYCGMENSCISATLACNQRKDCYNGEDEVGCGKSCVTV